MGHLAPEYPAVRWDLSHRELRLCRWHRWDPDGPQDPWDQLDLSDRSGQFPVGKEAGMGESADRGTGKVAWTGNW